jgi:hypothetical protein
MRRATFGILADFLKNQVKVQEDALICSDLSMVTLFSPNAGFFLSAEMADVLTFSWKKGKICLVCLDRKKRL